MKTYRELLEQLRALPEDQLDNDVTVYVSGMDEFYPLDPNNPMGIAGPEHDVLDPHHFYLII